MRRFRFDLGLGRTIHGELGEYGRDLALGRRLCPDVRLEVAQFAGQLARWEAEARVPGRPQMTDFRRRLRYHQSQWRESNAHPIGSHPIVPRKGKPSRPVGSRLPLDYARETGATFVTSGALDAATARTSFVEPHQSFDHQRLWADLLWSSALAFNLFGDLAGDLELADRAIHTWWPDAPGTVCEVRFAHRRPVSTGHQGIVGVNAVDRTGLLVTCIEHLLLLSMLQHERGRWSWGRYVAVYPADNPDFADAYPRYADFLTDPSTFSTLTIEGLLDADALPRKTARALRDRYISELQLSRVSGPRSDQSV